MSPRAVYSSFTVLGVLLAALAIFTVVQTSDLNSRIDDLEGSTERIERSTASGGKDTASEISRLSDDLQDVSSSLKKLRDCVPELQNQINGISVEVIDNYPYIDTGSQVSSYCEPIVYPPTDGVGE